MFELDEQTLAAQKANITTGEIKQQPVLWREVYDIYQQEKAKIQQFLKDAEKKDQKVRVIFTGAGTSAYVGDTLVPYLRSSGDHQQFDFESIGTTDIVAAPLDYLLPDEPTILVSFARSGNSPESLAAVSLAKKVVKDLSLVTITCAPEGRLAKEAEGDEKNLLLLMPLLSNDKGFAMTGSFTCMTLASLMVFDLKSDAEKKQMIEKMAQMGEDMIRREAELQEIIALDYNRIVYLGSGSLSGLTREAQLKVLELTAGKIATVFDSSLGFRHGPKSFVDEKTLVFGFLSNDTYTRQYDLDILEEVLGDKIAAQVTAIGQKKSAQNFTGNTFALIEEGLPEAYLALPCVMVAQTIALLSSIKCGNTPDDPSPTGTVNRVVQGVTIHAF